MPAASEQFLKHEYFPTEKNFFKWLHRKEQLF